VRRLYVVGASIAAITTITIIVVLLLPAVSPKKDYGLQVSASITEEGAGRRTEGIYTAIRVSVENTGKMQLTNVSLSYTGTEGSYTSDYAERIEPGSKASFPPSSSPAIPNTLWSRQTTTSA
jgi:hypothetical protein